MKTSLSPLAVALAATLWSGFAAAASVSGSPLTPAVQTVGNAATSAAQRTKADTGGGAGNPVARRALFVATGFPAKAQMLQREARALIEVFRARAVSR